MSTTVALRSILVRYGAVPEVARFRTDLDALDRGDEVVVRTHRGLLVGTVLELVRSGSPVPEDDEAEAANSDVIRRATPDDLALRDSLRAAAEAEFEDWCERILTWKCDVDLLDLEWTLDHDKRILYVLSDRGPGSTHLALQAAAAGLGIIEVQPVASDGPIPVDLGGGCGSGGCGCSH